MSNKNNKRIDIDVPREPKGNVTEIKVSNNVATTVTPTAKFVNTIEDAVEPEVDKILKDKAITFKERLEKISKLETQCGILVKNLFKYESLMGNSAKELSADEGARCNYSFYNHIYKVISNPSYKEFRQKFHIINLFFIVHKESSCSIFKLNRYDYRWPLGNDTKLAYRRLMFIITELADITTRRDKLSRLSLNRIMENRVFTNTVKNNINSFYRV